MSLTPPTIDLAGPPAAPPPAHPPGYRPVPVAAAAELARQYGKDQVVVLAVDHAHKMVHTATWGRAADDKVAAAGLGDLAARLVTAAPPHPADEDFRSAREAALTREALEAARARVAALEAALAPLARAVNYFDVERSLAEPHARVNPYDPESPTLAEARRARDLLRPAGAQ